MFIIVIGTRAAGKSTVQDYLLKYKNFKHVRLVYSSKPAGDRSHENSKKSANRNVAVGEPQKPEHDYSSEDTDDTTTGQHATFTGTHRRGGSTLDTPASFLSMTSSAPSTLAEPEVSTEIDGTLGFTDPARLLDHVTRHWRDNFVTEDITTRDVLERFLKRPFVLLVSVDAPALVRFQRHQNRHRTVSLEQFIADDDRISFGPDSDHITSAYLFASYHLCHVNVINSFPSVPQLHVHLDALDLLNTDRLRPSWDSYFMKLASLASHRSNCMKRRVGAILVRDHAIIATGYNGTPRGVPNCNEGGCKRCNEGGPGAIEGFEECLCIHAEENALLEAGRERVGKGAVIYCNTCPCLKCTIKIVQNGVTEVVYNLSYKMDASSARVFKMAGVKLRQYSPPG